MARILLEKDWEGEGGGDERGEGFDAIEAALLKEEMLLMKGGMKGSGGGLQGLDFDKKINLSVRIQNDITRSEKKSEKRANYHGKDDRATSEQVLDPRTRLILFKMLSNGFLEEIDGNALPFLPLLFLSIPFPLFSLRSLSFRLSEYREGSECLLCQGEEWS